MIYIFAGHRRRADVREHLEALARKNNVKLNMHEFDLVRDSKQDVLDEKFWNELVAFIRKFSPFCIIATPPCSTYSRARHMYKQSPGPRPIRSRQYPQGFPWLSSAKQQQAQQGTILATKTWDLSSLAAEINSKFLSEFPEDLGFTPTGVPASLWQMQQFQDNLMRPHMKTFALFQCEYGAHTPKPTRFMSDLDHFHGNFYSGVPIFNNEWKYMGPLPPCCPHPGQHDQLIGMDADGKWKTAPAAHYPGPLCEFLATAIFQTWQQSSSATPGPGNPTEDSLRVPDVLQDPAVFVEDSVDSNVLEGTAPFKIASGCEGPPLKAKYAGRSEEFCDGMGLCSPGRWHPRLRGGAKTAEQTKYIQDLRDTVDDFCKSTLGDLGKSTMALALGHFASSPFSEEQLGRLRLKWFNMLPDPGLAAVKPKSQPFYLHALAQSLRLMGDPDVDIIDAEGDSNFVEGVHLGHETPLGPTPQVYRPRAKEPTYDDSEWTLCMDNYFRGDENEAQAILETQFKEEEAEGRMLPISQKEAERQYPGKALRIAAQGILDKPDGGHRIIHDGTHGVHLNNEIKIEDRLENPGPRELSCLMETSVASGERVIFTVNADIAKAHRRVRVRKADWGVQACKASSSSPVVWLNTVGTFGVASAAFWWSRLMGLVGRHALCISRNDWLFVLTFVDDLHIAAGGQTRWLTIWRFIVCLEMVGTPFSYRKFRGGFQSDYVGYWMDYSRFELGISEKRTAWLVAFIDKMETDGWLVMVRRFHEFHGRLGFASQVLPWIKPLLAPGYSWLAAVGKMATLKVPELVAIVCVFIRDKFKRGLRKIPCGRPEQDLGEVFRTDAKCEAGRVVLGGWKVLRGQGPEEADWFALELEPRQVPWLFRGPQMESSWASTSAELLASLVALKVFDIKCECQGGKVTHLLLCGGGTDNKAASQLVQKGLSTKMPLMVVLMDYLGYCEEMGLRCHLDWRPRDVNVEADDLTNLKFDSFNLAKRIKVRWESLEFPMIELLMRFSETFAKRKAQQASLESTDCFQKFEKSTWG